MAPVASPLSRGTSRDDQIEIRIDGADPAVGRAILKQQQLTRHRQTKPTGVAALRLAA
jgi:hypothetical protein